MKLHIIIFISYETTIKIQIKMGEIYKHEEISRKIADMTSHHEELLWHHGSIYQSREKITTWKGKVLKYG